MSHSYQAVGWNRQKRRYDATLGAALLLYLLVFAAVSLARRPTITAETLVIRAFGTAALALLHVVLCIGPLARLDRRFLPLLYNRRHLGVAMALCALAHGAVATIQFHALGDVPPLVSLLAGDGRWSSASAVPFQTLGLLALVILVLMAATSHDYWLATLSPRLWKGLHMLVYVAYALLVAHVAFGALQQETSPVLAALLGLGMLLVVALHLIAAERERRSRAERDRTRAPARLDRYVDVGAVEEIPDNRAKVVTLNGERVAVFRYDGRVSCVSNVCRHQMGPLGEGRIVGGCITCPWHGYQYRPADGQSPPPFTDRIATYDVRVRDGRVLVDPTPHAPGTFVPPAAL
jgi:nitrite reductase/ring-hydroxylating ferredoxin subunit/DMSO/TMAO reductase YedYZ heme-binding membrane subunit